MIMGIKELQTGSGTQFGGGARPSTGTEFRQVSYGEKGSGDILPGLGRGGKVSPARSSAKATVGLSDLKEVPAGGFLGPKKA
jgi:hypothetical protein